MSTNESEKAPLPPKLRWYQFSLRSIFVVMTLFALGLGLYIQNENKRAESREHEVRRNYIGKVAKWFQGHDLWKKNPTLAGENFWTHGNSSGRGDGNKIHYVMELCYHKHDAKVPPEALKTLIEIYRKMDIFCDPQEVVISDDEALLASPEGWLMLKVKWLSDDPRVGEVVQVLQIDQDFYFQPQHAPTEKQDWRKRMPWLKWIK